MALKISGELIALTFNKSVYQKKIRMCSQMVTSEIRE